MRGTSCGASRFVRTKTMDISKFETNIYFHFAPNLASETALHGKIFNNRTDRWHPVASSGAVGLSHFFVIATGRSAALAVPPLRCVDEVPGWLRTFHHATCCVNFTGTHHDNANIIDRICHVNSTIQKLANDIKIDGNVHAFAHM